MNISTPAHSDIISAEMIESLQDWWALAGVDNDYDAMPQPLLQKPAPVLEKSIADQSSIAAVTAKGVKSGKQPDFSKIKNQNFPETYDAFLSWLEQPENLVESKWSGKYVLPTGSLNPKIMTISALPELNAGSDLSSYSQGSAHLLQNMLKAIGVDSQQTYHATLSLTRPVDGRIGLEYYDALKKRALHLVSLVKPQQIILFGDTAARIFFNENLLDARKKKQFINHVSSKTEAIVTFHPRILLERPEFKAEAWKDLQLLTRTTTP